MLILSRSQLISLESTDMALANVVTMSYLRQEKASYGAYYMWSHIGTAVSICLITGLAWFIKTPICANEEFGYFMASFQIYREFWYLDRLSASPLLLGGAALIRRPFVSLFSLVSSYLIKRIGDLNSICFALFLYSLSFLALSFTRIAWLVLIIDTLQATAYGISYCAFTVHSYKASSTENSSIILGM